MDTIQDMIATQRGSLAAVLDALPASGWDQPTLCAGWRVREVVAHVTMPARYDGPAFMAELEANGGDFTRLSNAVATRDGALPMASLLAWAFYPTLRGTYCSMSKDLPAGRTEIENYNGFGYCWRKPD